MKSASAIPSFARQTGLECTSCHTTYPQLTPFGRNFKLHAYTMGDKGNIIRRVSAWLKASYTHTKVDQTEAPADGFNPNNNFALDEVSLFYGGRLAKHVGAFLQGTYDGVEKAWAWDNMDVRYANDGHVGNTPVTFGVSLNNSPTVQDLWNTTPVWGFPFDDSGLAPGPAAGTLIEEGLAQISAGVTVYAMWNNHLYTEVGIYHTLGHGALDFLTGGSEGVPKSSGVAPYWRIAWQNNNDQDNINIGMFGLQASLYPESMTTMGYDSYRDLGFDAQYQHFGAQNSITVRMSVITEHQKLPAMYALAWADNMTNTLNHLNMSVAYVYHSVISLSAGVGHLWGTSDMAYYGTVTGAPDSTSFTFQGDWLPFNNKPISTWPWFNPRFSIQYTHYTLFDGSKLNIDGAGRKASDNDTLFLLMTLTL